MRGSAYTSATGGRVFYGYYKNPTYGSNPNDIHLGTFEVKCGRVGATVRRNAGFRTLQKKSRACHIPIWQAR